MAPFSADTAVMLIVITYAIGALFGLAFSLIWNWLVGRPGSRVRGQLRQRGRTYYREPAN